MESINLKKIEAGVIVTLFIIGGIFFPLSSALKTNENNILLEDIFSIDEYEDNHPVQVSENNPYIIPENYFDNKKLISFDEIENDMGYNNDGGNTYRRSLNIYPGERVDNAPGRTRAGTLAFDSRDTEDWYKFYVCEGQTIQASISTSQNFDIDIADPDGNIIGKSVTADVTDLYFIRVIADEGAAGGSYTIDVSIEDQNDVNTGSDAGDDISSATSIVEGEYYGYMDINDVEDWYSFSVDSGQGIYVNINPLDETDYDLHLYDPDDILVLSEQYYGEDTIEYPADKSGTWKIKIDMFPGWDESKWPDNYFLYGSGPYELTLELGGIYEQPIEPLPQPEITPIAQTFVINDNPDSLSDEYSYIAAIPAANYIDNGNRFVSPIIYRGVDDLTNWFGTIDDTTQYLVDDWNSYLDRHGLTADEYIIPDNPIQAAADIAGKYWESSDTAVLVCDGSGFEDDINVLVDDDFTLSSTPDIRKYYPGDFKTFNDVPSVPMYIGSQWGAIHMIALGENFNGDTGLLTPRYEEVKFDDWPHPYDEDGPDYDTWYPITKPGIWIPELTPDSTVERMLETLEELQIILYPGDRYNIPIRTTDCSIEVKLETDEPSTLLAYLIDPEGNVRRPNIPKWNGGEIEPLHWWNGGHWEHNFDEYRYWIVEPHTEFSVDLHYPMEGTWNLIVVPYFDHPDHYGEFNGVYHLTTVIRNHNPNRVNAALSAANAAVIASSKHSPLLYVTEDSIPSETANQINSLGVSNIIFVNLNEVSSATPTGTFTEYTTMQQIVDVIKDNTFSDNFITITSLGSGKGFFAPAAMLSAYHTSPVLSIHEAAEGYDLLDKMVKWEEFVGDHYHGCRTMGHLPALPEPINIRNPPSLFDLLFYFLRNNQEIPPIGLDLKLQWYSEIYQSIYSLIDNYGLDIDGKEAYMFVSPRDNDIASHVSRVFMGNESYSGHIMFDTPAMDSAQISRSILYPALIYVNDGRDITSAVLMNHWEDEPWITNDGVQTYNDVTRKIKKDYSSHGRTYEGHTLWNNLLERYNEGASAIYHCSHGTGGSAMCVMYENIEEQFPLAELTHEHLKDFDWWDGWRGYYYDDSITSTPRENGRFWCNANDAYGNLYDPIHFKWADQLFDNLHSQFNLWMSCTTGHNFGPEIYLEHGAVLWYGNSNTGRSPQTDYQDSIWFEDFFVNGLSLGEAQTSILWNFDRDYTTLDPTSIYGVSSMDDTTQVQGSGDGLVNTWVVFGDPSLQIYNPTWVEPTPIQG